MPSFDVVSRVDMQEVRNAVDQAMREVRTRFDFKNTDSSITLDGDRLVLRSATEDRLRELRELLEEKLVRRKVSLKSLDPGKIEEAAGGTVRQVISITAGISSEKAKQLNRFIKDLGIKGVQSQTQGDHIRVTSKKKDHLQQVIAALRESDFGIPLQFVNMRD